MRPAISPSARGRVENLSQRVTDLDRQLIVQVKEAEMLGSRVTDLEGRLATQGKLLAERDYENNQLRQLNGTAERTIKQLRDEVAAGDGGKAPAIEKLRSEKAAVEEAASRRPRRARQIAARHQHDPAAGRKLWATERMENALLRERINDIAAEVAKLAMTLEGPNSPIEAILGNDNTAAAKAANGATANGGIPEGGHASRTYPGAAVPCLPGPPAGRMTILRVWRGLA